MARANLAVGEHARVLKVLVRVAVLAQLGLLLRRRRSALADLEAPHELVAVDRLVVVSVVVAVPVVVAVVVPMPMVMVVVMVVVAVAVVVVVVVRVVVRHGRRRR